MASMLKEKADVKSVVYMMVTSSLLALLWVKGTELPIWSWALLYIWFLHMAVTVAVMVHNHKHVPMWRSKWANVLTDNWLTVFYGFPVFSWVPTHMHNHHRHVNTLPDYTRTWRYTERNNLLTLLSYPSISGMNQQPPVRSYYLGQWKTDRNKFWLLTLQIVCLVVWTGAALLLDWKKALLYVIVPQQVSLFSVLIFNYVQHIHADETDEYNNSRNIVGWALNFFLLNNGYHTAHHLHPGLHWSKLPQKHREIAHRIDPSLNEVSLWWFLIRTYILGAVLPSLRSVNMRKQRQQQPMSA
jgi:beta-carotene hydroxylase